MNSGCRSLGVSLRAGDGALAGPFLSGLRALMGDATWRFLQHKYSMQTRVCGKWEIMSKPTPLFRTPRSPSTLSLCHSEPLRRRISDPTLTIHASTR